MKHLFCLILTILASTAFGQQIPMQNYTVEDGLPSPELYDIVQDDYGYLWFSTDHGLSRYNGYEFENFTTKDGLTDNTIFTFYKHEDGSIWCNTFNHTLFTISGSEPTFTPYKYNHKITDLITDRVNDHEIFVDAKGTVFLSYTGTRGYVSINASGEVFQSEDLFKPMLPGKINLCLENNEKVFSYVSANDSSHANLLHSPELTNSHSFTRATYLKKNRTAIFMQHIAVLVVKDNKEPKKLTFAKNATSLGLFDSSHFWVGFRSGGIRIIDHNGSEKKHFLKGITVTNLYQDHEGFYWISTLSSGVFRIKNWNIGTVEGLEADEEWIESLAQNAHQKLYAGGYDGTVYTIEKDSIRTLFVPDSKLPSRVFLHKKRVVFTAADGLFKLKGDQPKKRVPGFIISWSPTENGEAIGRGGELKLIRGDTIWKKINTRLRVSSLHLFKDTLFSGSKQGLFALVQDSLVPYHQNIPFCSYRIDALASTNDALLIGTRGNGLGILTNDSLIIIDKTDGLTGNFVSNIYVENDQRIWLCTTSGLNLITLADNNYTIQTLTDNDGLLSSHVSDIELIEDTVWVATRKGICFFHRSLLNHTQKPAHHFLRMLTVKVNDKTRVITEKLELNYNENRLAFNFMGISFKSKLPLEYRYKLNGLDKDWTYTTNRKILYPSIPPGDYQLILQARQKGQTWGNEELTLAILIYPPYWQTWWFISSIVVAVALLIYLFFRYSILSYNRDITRELLRQVLKRISRKTQYLVIREQGKDIKIDTARICFIKSDGNYLEVHTDSDKFVIRSKIGEFLDLVPDPIEFLRIHRSYIIRLDKVEQKSAKELVIKGEEIPVGKTYTKELKNIKLKV
jgi:ligand-binding sensor domain-containing protein